MKLFNYLKRWNWSIEFLVDRFIQIEYLSLVILNKDEVDKIEGHTVKLVEEKNRIEKEISDKITEIEREIIKGKSNESS